MTETTTTPTTLGTWAQAIARTLESLNLDADTAFQQAGLDRNLARDPNARYPVSGMTKLWHAAVELSGDPAIGLKVAEQVQPASLHALGLSVLASETPYDALQRVSRYSRIVSNAAHIELHREGNTATVCFHVPDWGIELAHEAFDAFLGNMVKLGRMLSQRNASPSRVDLVRPKPVDSRPWEDFFQAPIEYGAEQCRLHFEADILDEPLPSANPALARLNDQVIVDYLARFDKSQVALQVRNQIIERLPSGEPSQSQIASQLNMSLRGLQRRLKEESTSFKQLLEETRKELA
ncbi:MAG: AraC family transcriptional regulator ligand-binding domain-containing protein, partial [Nevskiales bacterium]